MSSGKSSNTTTKLLHLTDLPNSKKYVAHEMGHLLPFHHSSLKQNILTMIYYESSNFAKNIIYDSNLTMYSTNYSKIRGGWCQDIDNDDNHLKRSMQIGIIIINYLHSLSGSKVKHNHSDNSIVTSGSSFYISSKYENLKGNYKKHQSNKMDMIQIQRQPDAFANSQNCISYNIYKHNKKYIFITGVNQCNCQGYYHTMSIFRRWNFKRLKCSWLQKFSISRLSQSLQHLIAISRGFIINFQQSSFFNRCDHDLNQNKKYLKSIASLINLQRDNIYDQMQQLIQNERQVFNLLEESFLVYRFNFTYRQLQQPNFAIQIQNKLSKVVCHILSEIPNNIPVSYCCRLLHQQKNQKIVIMFILNYKSSNIAHKLVDNVDVNRSLSRVCQLIQKQCYLQLKNSSKTIADEVFRNSYVIFNKFNKEVNYKALNDMNSKSRFSRQQQSLMKEMRQSDSIQSVLVNIGKNQQPAFYNEQQRSTLSLAADLNKSKSSTFQKSVAFSDMQRQYGKLISKIEQQKYLLTDKQLISFLKQYLLSINAQLNQTKDITWKQINALNFIAGVCYKLTPKQTSMLIKNNIQQSQALLEFFVQQSNINKMVQVINLEESTINQLFKQYLTQGFVKIRYHFILSFLKKLMNAYFKRNSFSISIKNTFSQEIKLTSNQVAILISLIQDKQNSQRTYISLISQYLPVIFVQSKYLKFISSILYNFYIALVGADHHEELVNSFIAEMCFQVLYYSDQFNQSMLNNSVYLRTTSNIKQKKILQIVRKNGFMGLGFELKNTLLPQIIQNGFAKHNHSFLVSKIKIQNAPYFSRVLDILTRSHFTDNIIEVINYVKFNQDKLKSVSKQAQFFFYPQDFTSFQFNTDYFSLNLNLSESGIFDELSKINPHFKIAGRTIGAQMDKKLWQNQKYYNKFTLKYIDDNKILEFNPEECFQLINLTKNLKLKYQKLSSMKFQQKAYMREAFQQIYNKKGQIYKYLQFCQQIQQLKGQVQNVNDSNLVGQSTSNFRYN